MSSARKRLNIVLQQLDLLEIIYTDHNMPDDYFENIKLVKDRIYKLPKMAELKPDMLVEEIEWISTEVKEMFDEVLPETLLKYRKMYNRLTFGGNEGSIEDTEL